MKAYTLPLALLLSLIACQLPAEAESKRVGRALTRAQVKKGLASVCTSQRSPAGGEIWKSRQSPHIPSSDRRKNSTALIYLRSVRPPANSCLSVVDGKGNVIHRLGVYARGESLYSARFYGGSGCGDGKTPGTVASIAKRNTKSTAVYIDVGSVCIKIANPQQCYNSVGC